MLKQRYEATARETVRVPYGCMACGFAGVSVVSMGGTANRSVRAFTRDERHQQETAFRASEFAEQGAEHAARIARCPGCGKRSAVAMAAWRRKYVWPGLAVAIITNVVVALVVLGLTFVSGGGGYGLVTNTVLGAVGG